MTPGIPDWVVIRNCLNIIEANFIRSVLEGSGIQCFLPDEHTIGVRPELALALGGVRILVRAHDFERANEVLNQLRLVDNPDAADEP